MSYKIISLLVLILIGITACTRPAPPESRLSNPVSTQIQTRSASTPPTPEPTNTPPPTATPVPAARVHAAEQALLNGDWEKALAEYQLAGSSSDNPEVQAEVLLGSARSYLLGRNEYEAIAQLQRLLEEQPQSHQEANAHFFLARAYTIEERYAEAAQEYQTYLELKPGAIDGYIHDIRGDMLSASGDYPNAAEAYQAVLEAQSVLDEIPIRMKMARAYTLAGDAPTALTLYDDIYIRTNNEYTRALIDLRKGQIYTELGDIESAHAAYLDAVNNYPLSYDSYKALVELVDAGVTVDELQRGIVDYHAGQYGPALAAFDHYLQNNPDDAATARYYYGLTARAQGNHEEAIRQWDILIAQFGEHALWDDAWEQKAYTQWANMDLYEDAIDTLTEFSEQAADHPRAAEFLFDAGLVAEQDSQLNRAIEIWELQASSYPNDERTTRSRFLAALTRFRLEDYKGAEDAFQRFLSEAATLEDKAAGHFWNGKSLNAAGDSEGARSAWQTAASVDPTGYYSERARDYLHDRETFAPPLSYDLAFDLPAERKKAELWVKTTFALPPDTDLSGPGDLVNDPYLRRGLELWDLGLYDEARGEFEILRQLSENDPARTFRLANLFVDLGAYRSAIMAARRVLDLANFDDATSLSAPAYFNHVRFGIYYSKLVMPLAQEYGFHPLFLYALIRQESLFEGFVSSSAGARGLMQIIPLTGEEIAANLGWPEDYTEEDLYRPLVSLTLGVDYLNRQRDQFDGDVYAALAAYNGGPGNAAAWLELAPEDPDLFLEVIRYAETRDYIRRIYENFSIYRIIYNRTP
jgi:soluble lytic murein transglycosylase